MEQPDAYQNTMRYVRLRDTHFDIYVRYARRFGIPVKSLFVLSALYDAPEGCTEKEICLKAYSSKQTISAIIKGCRKHGLVELTELPADRRNKLVRLTEAGWRYAEPIIPPIAKAETAAMACFTPAQQNALVEMTALFGKQLQQLLEEQSP